MAACWIVVVLGGCGSDTSTHVVVKVDNSVDDTDPNLVIIIRDEDDDETPAPSPVADSGAATGARLEGSVATARGAPASSAALPELAYVRIDAQGRAGGIALVSSRGEALTEIGSALPGGISGLSWSGDAESLRVAAADGVHFSWRQSEDMSSWSELESLVALPGVAAVESGPVFESGAGVGESSFEVMLASAPDAAGGPEDLFAIFLDSAGEVLGVQNLTRTPEHRELDAAWLSDGVRVALLERSDRDAIVLLEVSVEIDAGTPRAALERGAVLWSADPGALADLSAARTLELLAVSAWTGRDWDVLCIGLQGDAVAFGDAGVDERAPSWSRDDRRLAVEQRCTSDACGPLPVQIWELAPHPDPARCPEPIGSHAIADPGSHPAWRP